VSGRAAWPRGLRVLRLVALCLVALAVVASVARPRAEAQDSLPALVLVVLGRTEGEGSDPQLAALDALKKPPFDTFTRQKLLKRTELRLEFGKESELELPNGRKLRLLLVERLPDGRLRVSLSINRPGQRDYLPVMTVSAAPGDPFFVAGQKHEGGTLIIGVRVGYSRV